MAIPNILVFKGKKEVYSRKCIYFIIFVKT